MKPDKLTVHDLFQRERRYVVPLYQRSYVWNLDDQWEPLWQDIERHAEDCLTAPNNVARRSHFLGAIVLNVAKIVGSAVARSEIIDGQQRLTTLQVFLAALRDHAAEIGSRHASKIARLTGNEDELPRSGLRIHALKGPPRSIFCTASGLVLPPPRGPASSASSSFFWSAFI
jgi:uncharacterized protein with ParB-like and HNH nuclease domain